MVAANTSHTKKARKLSQRRDSILIRSVREDQLISSKQELFIPENGKVDSETDMVNRYGPMVLSMLENGERTEHTVKVSLFT